MGAYGHMPPSGRSVGVVSAVRGPEALNSKEKNSVTESPALLGSTMLNGRRRRGDSASSLSLSCRHHRAERRGAQRRHDRAARSPVPARHATRSCHRSSLSASQSHTLMSALMSLPKCAGSVSPHLSDLASTHSSSTTATRLQGCNGWRVCCRRCSLYEHCPLSSVQRWQHLHTSSGSLCG